MRTRFTDGKYHEPGVYFGMPFEEYAEDWSLGSSDLVNLLISPTNYYWYSRANPRKKERPDTPALIYGRAVHKAVLEPHRFLDEYGRKAPDPEPGMLVSAEDLRNKCKELGLPKSGNKTQLIERIRAAGDTTPIYDEIVDEYNKKMGNRILLSHAVYDEVVQASEVIKYNYHLDQAFEGGYPEVSVFFEHLGAPMRARFDYLKPSCIVDLKSIRNHLKQEWHTAVGNAIARHQYHIQAVAYLQARAAVNRFIAEGRVFGNPIDLPNGEWLEAVAREDDFFFYWIFFQAEGAPLTLAIRFDHNEPEFITSSQKIESAIDTYKEYLNRYDRNLWVETHAPIQFTNLGLPDWAGR
jgi:hypothetical protein